MTNNKKLVIFGSSAGGIEAANAILPHLKLGSNSALWVSHIDVQTIGSRAALYELGGEFFSEPYERYTIHSGKLYVIGNPEAECRRPYVSFNDITQVTVNPEPVKEIETNVSRTFAAAVRVYKYNLLAVILKGAGNDGTRGAKIVKKQGGQVIVQDLDISQEFPGYMPHYAIVSRTVDHILPLEGIVRYVNNFLQ